MFLKAPSGSDRPKANRSNKGAFTNRPLPKRKAFKPPEEEEEVKVQKQDTAFTTWAKTAMHDCDPIYQNVVDYAIAGSPFRGNAAFGRKDEAKDAGAKWLPNPSYDEQDRRSKRGWWSAWDDKTLYTLLSLNKKSGEVVWSCHGDGGMLVEMECSILKDWMDKFYSEVHGEDEVKRMAARCDSIAAIARAGREAEEASDRASEPAPSEPMSPDHPSASAKTYKQWPGDTVCSACKVVVTCQFLDCHCPEATWQRCAECWLKWRSDPGAPADTACGCAGGSA
jgi:hypothetical protein